MAALAWDRNLGRAIGVLLLIAIFIGSYDLELEAASKTSEAALEALFGEYSGLTQNFRTLALTNAATAALSLVTGAIFFVLLRRISGVAALTAFLLRLIDIALGAASVWISIQLASIFADASGSPADLSKLADPYQDLSWKTFHYGLAASSIGAAVNFALMFKGRYIPRALSAYGVLASLFVAVSIAAMELSPVASQYVYPAYVIGNAIAFISLTLWLLVRGVDTGLWNPHR